MEYRITTHEMKTGREFSTIIAEWSTSSILDYANMLNCTVNFQKLRVELDHVDAVHIILESSDEKTHEIHIYTNWQGELIVDELSKRDLDRIAESVMG